MRNAWMVALLLLGSGSLAAAQEKQEEDTVKAVHSDFNSLRSERYEAQRKNPPAKDVAPMLLVSEDEAVGFIERCWKIYDRSAGEPAEFEALTEILSLSVTSQSSRLEKEWREAINKLGRDFVDDTRMADLVMSLPVPRRITKEGDDFVAKVEKTSKAPAVVAAFAFRKVQPDLNNFQGGQLDEKGEKALAAKLNDLAQKYGSETVPFRKVTYADFAKKTIFAMEHLKVGAVAPDISANDLDGIAFKLSDYRGKVVMLDFWGYW